MAPFETDVKVRRARRSDLDFVTELLIESLTESIPHPRDVTGEEIRDRARTELDLKEMLASRREYAFLIATIDTDPVGFLILELNQIEETTGEPQTLIYHLAVAPNYMGLRIDRVLINEAAKLTHSRGCRYMIGRISAGNRRALLTALRQGFELERHQVVIACGAEGKEPMPGRDPSELHHDLRRLAQREQRGQKRR